IPRVDPKRLDVSGIVIGDREASGRVTIVGGQGSDVAGGALSPTALRRLPQGTSIPVLIEVYPPARNRAEVVVVADVRGSDGEPLLAQERRIAGARGQGPGAGVVTFDIPTANLE